MRLPTRFTSFTLALLFAGILGAAPLEIDRAAAAMSGQEASFTQRFTPKGFKTAQAETGTVVFGTLPMMRWSYVRPEQKLFVFDGTRSWFYVPGDRQVIVATVDDARRRSMPFLFLGDPARRDQHFVTREQSRGGKVVTTLQPRATSPLIRNVTVTIDPKSHRVERIDYSDRDGNQTSFAFTGYHARATSADLFRFKPPAGVQVIEE